MRREYTNMTITVETICELSSAEVIETLMVSDAPDSAVCSKSHIKPSAIELFYILFCISSYIESD